MKIIKLIWDFICDMGQASYAAHLARNGHIERSKAIYK